MVVNFEIMHNRCRVDQRKVSDKHYQAVVQSDVKNMSQKDRKLSLSVSVLREKISL